MTAKKKKTKLKPKNTLLQEEEHRVRTWRMGQQLQIAKAEVTSQPRLEEERARGRGEREGREQLPKGDWCAVGKAISTSILCVQADISHLIKALRRSAKSLAIVLVSAFAICKFIYMVFFFTISSCRSCCQLINCKLQLPSGQQVQGQGVYRTSQKRTSTPQIFPVQIVVCLFFFCKYYCCSNILLDSQSVFGTQRNVRHSARKLTFKYLRHYYMTESKQRL